MISQINQWLLEAQLKSENPIFQLLHYKKQNGYEFDTQESRYCEFIQTTYKVEVLTCTLMLPSTIAAYKLTRQMQQTVQDTLKIAKYSKLTILVALPGLHCFLYAQYRRFIQNPPYFKDIEQKYQNEMRPKLKLIDSKLETTKNESQK